MSAKSTWNLFPVRLFFFSFVTQSIRECQYSHLYMMDTQIYRNFLTPQTSNEISLGGFLKFSVLVERTATITWESAGIARLRSLSETRNFIPSFCHSSISFPFFLDQNDFVNVIFPFNIFQYCKNIFTLVRRLYYFCPKLTYKKLGKFQFADIVTKVKP